MENTPAEFAFWSVAPAERGGPRRPDHWTPAGFFLVAALVVSSLNCAPGPGPRGSIAESRPEAPAADRGELAALRRCIRERRWVEAVAEADAAIARGAVSSEVYLLKGKGHQGLDQFEAAEGALLEAHRRERTAAEPLYILAEMAERQGARGRCEDLYRRILDEVDPQFMPAREQLIRVYLSQNQFEAAAECFAGFARQGQTGPTVARCRAYLTFKTSRDEARLQIYQAELERIVAEHPDDLRSHGDLAILLFASQEYAASLAETERALALEPDDFRSRELKVLIEARLLRFDAAEQTLQGLLADRPRNAGYQRQLVELALDQAKFDAAAARLRALIDREDQPDRRAPLTGQLVEVLKLWGRYDEAAAVAEQWRSEDPQDPLRRATHLAVLSKAGRHGAAAAAAEEWLAEDPTNIDLRLQWTAHLAAAGRYVEVQQRLLGWLEEAPDDLRLNGELIRSCWLTGQWDGAIELAQVGAEELQNQSRYEEWLCRSYVLARRFDEAAAFYRDRIDLLDSFRRRAERANDLSALRMYHEALKGVRADLIATLTTAQRFEEAEELVNELLGVQIDRRKAGGVDYDAAWLLALRRMLATIYQLTDRPVLAAQQLEEILAAAPKDPGTNNDLGYTWAEAGIRLDEAERMVRFAVGERPREYAFLDSLGWVRYRRGAWEEAVGYLQTAIRQGGNDAVIHDHLGDALYRCGRVEEAGEHWRQAVILSEPSSDQTPSPEDRRVRIRAQEKLRQLNAGQPVEVSPAA